MLDSQNSSELLIQWQEQWEEAITIWSPYISLREPTWCNSKSEAQTEGLEGSFAMIRLKDYKVVIDFETVKKYKVSSFGLQILAHEIGHHVLVPANRFDNALLLKRIRMALLGIEDRAPFVANVFADILINDHLQRVKELDMVSVYEAINARSKGQEKFYSWFMKIFEYLWRLKPGTLAIKTTPTIDADASLAAGIIRSFSKNWLDGAGRFALLAYPYLIENVDFQRAKNSMALFRDAESAGKGDTSVSGICTLDEGDSEGIVDPRDEEISSPSEGGDKPSEPSLAMAKNELGGVGPQQRYLNPGVYLDLMNQVNGDLDENLLIANYYKEIAMPYLIDFPVEEKLPQSEYVPEATDCWEVGESIEELDWFETTINSPIIIPGYTTRKRTYSVDVDSEMDTLPYNLYVGIDCSGSMRNPKHRFSWPVLAGTIVSLSALRAGAKVMACLSGEPGSYLETEGFLKDEKEILSVLTSYLGTGYAYGIPRLQSVPFKENRNKSHILIVSDDDIFSMLEAKGPNGELNYSIAEKALELAEGGGTFVLHSRSQWHRDGVERLQKMGWNIHYVTTESELVDFAHNFSEKFYSKKGYGHA